MNIMCNDERGLTLTNEVKTALTELSEILKKVGATKDEDRAEGDLGYTSTMFYSAGDGLEHDDYIGMPVTSAEGHYAKSKGFKLHRDYVLVPTENGEEEVCWTKITDRYLGVGRSNEANRFIWEWVFGGGWFLVDDTALGMSARIQYLFEKGVPTNFINRVTYDKYSKEMVGEYESYLTAINQELGIAQ